MQTADLIEKLSSEAPQLRRSAAMRLLWPAIAGAAASFLLMWAWLGIRPDLGHAMGTTAYWMKFGYTLLLAGSCFWLTERLGRPGTNSGSARLLAITPVVLLALYAASQMAVAPIAERAHLVLGSTHTVCPWRIVALSLPILVATIAGLRRLAPTHLIAAGSAAGLLAGAAGAWIYAFHCDESSAPFVAVWYTLGIAAVGALGGLSGKWLLRW